MNKKYINDFKSNYKKEVLSKLYLKIIKLLPHFGDYWIRHNLSTQNVTSISRTLYLNDLYKMIVDMPGVACDFLQKIKPRLAKGSVLAFDELNCKVFPSETTALNEVFGLNNIKLKKKSITSVCSWAVYGE